MIQCASGNTYEGYREYLDSKDWEKKREEALEFYGRMCALCGATRYLNVHHRHYKSIGVEDVLKDLTILCYKHHNWYHKGCDCGKSGKNGKKHKKTKKTRRKQWARRR